MVIADTEGIHYVYYNSSGVLAETTTATSTLFRESAIVCVIYWDVSAGDEIYFTGDNELHGSIMSGATHGYLHNFFGTQYVSGLTVGDILADQNGNDDEDARFSITAGALSDEDVPITNAGKPNATDTISLYAKTGTRGS